MASWKEAAVAALGLLVALSSLMAVAGICPPSGPWPLPPWCDAFMELPSWPPAAGPSTSATPLPGATADAAARPSAVEPSPTETTGAALGQTRTPAASPSIAASIAPSRAPVTTAPPSPTPPLRPAPSTPTAPTPCPTPAPAPTLPPGTVEFTVEVPANTPEGTAVSLELVDREGNGRRTFAMAPAANGTWRVRATLAELGGAEVRYRYMRNGWGFLGAEEFSPDAKAGCRTVRVGLDPSAVHDQVRAWRWMPERDAPAPAVPTRAGQERFLPRAGGEEFQRGVLFVDFWWGNFGPLLNTTHARLRRSNVTWVEIAPVWDYGALDPAPVITPEGFGHTYSDDELELHLGRTKADGFAVLMVAQVCCEDVGRAPFSPTWWEAWFEQYERYVTYFADRAESHGVDALILTGDEVALDRGPPDARDRLEAIYGRVRERYHGRLGRQLFLGGTGPGPHDLWPSVDRAPYLDRWDFFAVRLWAGIAERNDTSQDELDAAAARLFDHALAPLHERTGKPVVLSQVAWTSLDGGLQGRVGVSEPDVQLWEPYSERYALDLAEQAMGYEAVMRAVARRDYIVGVYPFTYWPDEFPLTKEYNVRGKPAEDVLARWYGAAG